LSATAPARAAGSRDGSQPARPLVALTTSWLIPEETPARAHAVMYRNYIDALEAVGLAPVLITPAHSTAAVTALLGVCDGLVLSGGGDVEAARLGEAPHASLSWVFPERDAVEWAALDIARDRGLPVLAICRGCQVLNVHRGGSLYQDLPSLRPGAVEHQQPRGWDARAHEIRVAPETRLRGLLGEERITTNSFHHQGIRDVAPSLRASAWTDDGLVEAIESADGEWVVGVQWHPERIPPGAPAEDPDRRLFVGFGGAVHAFRDRA
jgi:putative glutamine amidotransferase